MREIMDGESRHGGTALDATAAWAVLDSRLVGVEPMAGCMSTCG
jgi:hypothetical protein